MPVRLVASRRSWVPGLRVGENWNAPPSLRPCSQAVLVVKFTLSIRSACVYTGRAPSLPKSELGPPISRPVRARVISRAEGASRARLPAIRFRSASATSANSPRQRAAASLRHWLARGMAGTSADWDTGMPRCRPDSESVVKREEPEKTVAPEPAFQLFHRRRSPPDFLHAVRPHNPCFAHSAPPWAGGVESGGSLGVPGCGPFWGQQSCRVGEAK